MPKSKPKSEPKPEPKPEQAYAKAKKVASILELREQWPDNLALQCFDIAEYKTLSRKAQKRLIRTLRSGTKVPESTVGVYARYAEDYNLLRPFFARVISRYHQVDLEHTRHVSQWSIPASEGGFDLAPLCLPPLSMRVRTARNLASFPLPSAMRKKDRRQLEHKLGDVFEKLGNYPEFAGSYVSLTPEHPKEITQKAYQVLIKSHLMFKDASRDHYLRAARIARGWPVGRGCYISADREVMIWVGEEDHLRLMCMRQGTHLGEVLLRLKRLLDTVESLLGESWAYDDQFGVLASCPSNVGTGVRASVHMALPHLTRGGDDHRVKALAKPLGLSVRGLGGEHTPVGADGTVDISPSTRFGLSEVEIIRTLHRGLARIERAEKAAAQAPHQV